MLVRRVVSLRKSDVGFEALNSWERYVGRSLSGRESSGMEGIGVTPWLLRSRRRLGSVAPRVDELSGGVVVV